jgi:hypothetical protein
MPAVDFPGKADPDLYALNVTGDCMAPMIEDGDRVLCSPAHKPEPGNVVAVWLKDGRISVKGFFSLPPRGLECFAPGSEVQGALLLQTLNPQAMVTIGTEEIAAIHVVTHVIKQKKDEVNYG